MRENACREGASLDSLLLSRLQRGGGRAEGLPCNMHALPWHTIRSRRYAQSAAHVFSIRAIYHLMSTTWFPRKPTRLPVVYCKDKRKINRSTARVCCVMCIAPMMVDVFPSSTNFGPTVALYHNSQHPLAVGPTAC